MRSSIYLSLLIIVLLFSCKGKVTLDDFELDQGYDYFPLAVGKSITYQVDSIIFDIALEGRVVDTVSFLLKEEIVDTLIDGEGRLNYEIHRYVKDRPDESWKIKDIWLAVRTESRAERIEENLRYIKMVFPLLADVDWDGNLFVDKSTIISVEGETLEIFKGWSSRVAAIDEAEALQDYVSRDLLTDLLEHCEEAIDWLETQHSLIEDVSLPNYLQSQIDSE